jgi:DNA-binding PadR family transcriptional regulator
VQPSPTSYALLGLLSLRSWTTYELAQQAQRSLRYLFPRAERQLYAEAKRLADAGLAQSEVTFTGQRRSTTYAITPAGRKALREWLRKPPAPPVLETEVLLRSFFADLGRQQDLLAALDAARDQAIATQRELAVFAQSRLDGEAPFHERGSVVVLAMRFVADFHRLLEEWTVWAKAQVEAWDQPDGRHWDGARTVMADIAQRGAT